MPTTARVLSMLITSLIITALFNLSSNPLQAYTEPSSKMVAVAHTQAADEYPWPHNGCTASPNRVGAADFTYACNHHDGCYAEHWANRLTCDNWFLNDMMAECDRIPWPNNIPTMFDPVRACRSTGQTYYQAVRAMGERFYNSNGKQVRINAPMKIA